MKKYFLLLCLFSTIIQAQQNLWWSSNKRPIVIVNNAVISSYGSIGLNNSYVSIPSSTLYSLTNDYTVECYFYYTAIPSTGAIFSRWGADLDFALSCGSAQFTWTHRSTDNNYCSNISFTSPKINTWHHFAAVRNGSTVTIYIDGKIVAFAPFILASKVSNVDPIVLGYQVTGASYANCLVSNFRISTGVARYTSNFAIPAIPLLADVNTQLLLNTPYGANYLTDSSVNNFQLTTTNGPTNDQKNPFIGSGKFLRASKCVLSTTVTGKAPGTGVFTYECWFRTTSLAAGQTIMGTRLGYDNTGSDVFITNTGILSYQSGSGTITTTMPVSTIAINTWYHLAIVRGINNMVTVYLNGVVKGSVLDTRNLTSSSIYIGDKGVNNNESFTGNICDFRYSQEVIYNSEFTPPTAPLTSTANTALLLPLSYGGLTTDYSGNNFTITNNNTTVTDILNPFGL